MRPAARVLHDAQDLREANTRLGREISEAHPGGVLLVAVLKGSLIFLSDLVRRVTVPVESNPTSPLPEMFPANDVGVVLANRKTALLATSPTRLPPPCNWSTPPLTVVPPVYVLTLDRARRPAPVFVRPTVPAMTLSIVATPVVTSTSPTDNDPPPPDASVIAEPVRL